GRRSAPGGSLRERLAGVSAPGHRRGHASAGCVLPGRRRRATAGLRAAAALRLRRLRPHPAVAERPVTLARVSERRWALVTVLVAGAAFVVVAAVYMPWHPVPGGTPPPVSAHDVFTPAQLARADSFANPARYLGWSSLAVSLAVAIILGFTPLGPRM